MSDESTARFGTIWGYDAPPGEEYRCIWYPTRPWRAGVWLVEGGEHFELVDVHVGNYAQIVRPLPLVAMDGKTLTMDTASANCPISLTIRNTTGVPRKVVIEIEEFGSTPRVPFVQAPAGRAPGKEWTPKDFEKPTPPAPWTPDWNGFCAKFDKGEEDT